MKSEYDWRMEHMVHYVAGSEIRGVRESKPFLNIEDIQKAEPTCTRAP